MSDSNDRSKRIQRDILPMDKFGSPESYNHYAVGWAHAAERRETQYFEMFGNRGIYHKGLHILMARQ